MIFEKPINQTERNLPEQVQALYDGVGVLVEQLNTERAACRRLPSGTKTKLPPAAATMRRRLRSAQRWRREL